MRIVDEMASLMREVFTIPFGEGIPRPRPPAIPRGQRSRYIPAGPRRNCGYLGISPKTVLRRVAHAAPFEFVEMPQSMVDALTAPQARHDAYWPFVKRAREART